MTAPGDILVIGPSWVGDMVMSQSLYRDLVANRPGVAIDVLAPPWSAPLLARMPEVRRALPMPLGHGELGLGLRRRLGRQLRTHGYAQAIVLPNSFKSALIPWFAGIKRRTGWRGEMRYGLLNDLRLLDPAALATMVQRFVALGRDCPAPALEDCPRPALRVDQDQALVVGQRFDVAADVPLLALCPGAEFGGAKRWPPKYFARLAKQYLAQGWQVLLLGSRADGGACDDIVARCPDTGMLNACGRTTLEEAVDLLALAALVVSNDSGLMHVAAALERPVLGLYGPTSADFTPPLQPLARALSIAAECSPCFERECPLGHHRCMADLSPAKAQATLRELQVAFRAVR